MEYLRTAKAKVSDLWTGLEVTMKVQVDIPDRILQRETNIASCETDRKGLKARLEKKWRPYLRRYKPLKIPIRCEFCAYVGEAQWHCHNPESPQNHINRFSKAADICRGAGEAGILENSLSSVIIRPTMRLTWLHINPSEEICRYA